MITIQKIVQAVGFPDVADSIGNEQVCDPESISYDKDHLQVGLYRFPVSNPRLAFAQALQLFPFVQPRITRGQNVFVHSTATIGGQGFGYAESEAGHVHIKHFGGVEIGDNVVIGEHVNIHRGVFGNTVIGAGTKIDKGAHIAHNCKIGKNCLIIANSTLCGSVELGDNVRVALNAVIKEHVKVGSNSVIGLGAIVLKDVPENTIVKGVWKGGNPMNSISDELYKFKSTSISIPTPPDIVSLTEEEKTFVSKSTHYGKH